MNIKNIEQYYASLVHLVVMKNKGILNDADYLKAESVLASKYRIKKDSLYRANDLINNRFRVIYILPKKEDHNGSETDNKDRCVTKVAKEN